MKVQVVLPLTIVASVALMGIMRIRKREQDQQHRRASFGDIKLRVTNDVLGEYQSEKDSAQVNLDTAQKETSALDSAVKMGKDKADKTKGELDICNQGKTAITDELTILETELKNLQAANEKEEASWNSEVQTLKSQLEAQSPVCNFLKEGSQLESKLCAKKEEPEAAKKEEPEAAKKEEPKAKAAKQEEPKAEAAKQEEPKAEAAKQEEPKAEAAKQEEPKAEAAKQEEPKAEAAKQEEPKAEAPKNQEV
ncbi:TRIO and F-actin-binding protein [Collichthys lucidus]|uniref:TRIO and F-actin-binding protein n=1 Tax=Collichthys lucidus TaxID=240159 RepID=A0A4U5V2Q1_COLLU|nr:TRIO and F-actin-binding protein [Collichthys lucidus]